MGVFSYEVGAIFTIVDRASPVLRTLAAQFKEMNVQILDAKKALASLGTTGLAGLNSRLTGVNERITAIGKGAVGSQAEVTAAFAKIDASAAKSIDSLRAMKVEMGEIAAASRAVRGPAALPTLRRRGSSGGGHGGGGVGFSGPSVGIPGGSHMHLRGTAGLAALGAIGYGAYEEAEVEDATFQLLYHTGLPSTPANSEMFRRVIQDSLSTSGFSLNSIVEAAKTESRMFKGTPGNGVDVLPEMLRAASTEARLKGTSLDEAMRSLIGLAHMTKQYDPEAIKKLAPAFAFLSSSNPDSLGGMERAASYAVPILQSGMEIDPITSLMLGTVLTRAGATNTKSGTWLRNMMLNSLPGTSLMSKIAFKKHEEALRALGLVDEKDNATWFTDGKPDPFKMLDIASGKAAEIPLIKRAAYEKQLFGTQGFGAFALLADPAVREQLKALKKEMTSDEFKNRYATFNEDYSKGSPLQQTRQAWGDLQNVLMDIGKTTMPMILPVLKEVDTELKQWKTTIEQVVSAAGKVPAALTAAANSISNFAAAAAGITMPSLPRGDQGAVGAPFKSLTPAPPVPHIVPFKHDANNRGDVYLDHRKVGEVMWGRQGEFPTRAPHFDTHGSFAGPDYSFVG